MIKEAAEKAEIFINQNRSQLKNCNNFWLCFDAEKKPYLGVETTVPYKNTFEAYTEIKFFQIDKPAYKFNPKKFSYDALVSYEIDSVEKASSVYLRSIFVKQSHEKKTIAQQLMVPVHLETEVYDVPKIHAFYCPYDHGATNEEKVNKFYQKQRFNISDNTEALTTISKRVTPTEIMESKLKLINFPTEKHTFKVILNPKFLYGSAIKESVQPDHSF